MQVSVLIELDSQEPLVESATAAFESRAPTFGIENAMTPSRITISPDAVAVPLNDGDASLLAASSDPRTATRFAVPAQLEVDDLHSIPETVDGRRIFSEPAIAPFITCGGDPALGTAATVGTHLNTSRLHGRGLDGSGVAVAIVDTGINLAHLSAKLPGGVRFDAANSWTPKGLWTLPGAYPVDHGTMCAYDALIAAPKATLLDFPVLSGTAPGGAIAGRTLSVALAAYAQLLGFWAVAFAPGGANLYSALVVNNSWGLYHPSWDFPPGHKGRYIDNPSHPFNVLVGVLARSGADILFAAGNCGSHCPSSRCLGLTSGTIMGANAHPDVLTLAGCDTTGARVGYSSQGPSIYGVPTDKPDLTAYTHFNGSDAFGPGSPDSGTSTACPVAAGCVAAIRTKVSPSIAPPAAMFAQLKTTATTPAGLPPGWNGDYGHGIINPDAAAVAFGV